MKTARLLVFLGACLVCLGFVVAKPALADKLQSAKLTLSDPRPSTSSNHKYNFNINTAGGIEKITFQYCTDPGDTGCTTPVGLGLDSATYGGSGGEVDGNWTLASASDGLITFHHTGGTGQDFVEDQEVELQINGITNPAITDCGADVGASTDTCYVNIKTWYKTTDSGPSYIDNSNVSMTVVATISVTATVDPLFTFTVAGVGSSTVNNAITTSVSSAYNTLPFANLTANTPKYAAHKLTVTTNSNSGYTVSMKMVTRMTGVYQANNIDEFLYDTATPAVWSVPKAWTTPYGTTANTYTGWIGANTTDTDVAGFTAGSSPQGKFGPVSSSVEHIVMSDSDTDNGTTSVFVTYGIEANVYQPADAYTGVLYYNALPTY